ncbi:MAG: hypothetical protein IBJ04_12655 [Hydrogenophaga sp.]|uniref:Uncharacterized protein n=1 Tax=Hydrogenophaga crocea TaxID=2716225 RepID=A0A6G8ICJ9_9BURK|nr:MULTISPECIES: hypothetical protein [Hydrogenophaga]MBL0945173.1 hypothetical protein [Hydrogenophaga sp.]QIM50863.1 hypothetical protein G9Q37_01330 [Hydrogenophaga crocea]
MPIHLYTNKNPHIPTRDLPGGMPAKLVRGAKDVLQHGLRVGKAVVLLPRHLKQQIFNGGPKRWIDPSRRQLRKGVLQQAKAGELRRQALKVENDRLEAAAKAVGQTESAPADPKFQEKAERLKKLGRDLSQPMSESSPKDRAEKARLDQRLLKKARKIEEAYAMPRVAAEEAPDQAALEENHRRVSVALDAYQDGIQGFVTDENLKEADFHKVTRHVLRLMEAHGMIESALVQQFDAHCAARARAPDAQDRFNPALTRALEEHSLVRANVGQAWYRAGLVLPEVADAPNTDTSGNLFTSEAIKAWYSTPAKADKA